MSNKYDGVPCPLFDEPFQQSEELGSAEMVFLDVSKLNKHNFYFMKRRFNMITHEMLVASKKLQEAKTQVEAVDMSLPIEDEDLESIIDDLAILEDRFDRWMMNQEEE